MKLTLENGDLQLPGDFTFELQLNNPFFSDEGSSSIPATLPASQENLAVLGYPTRLGSSPKMRMYPAILSHGVFRMNGNLVVASAGTKDGIVCSLATKESILYSSLQEMSLKDLFKKKEDHLFGTKAMGGNADDVLSTAFYNESMEAINQEFHNEGLVVFPVRVDDDGFGVTYINEPSADGDGLICEKRTLEDEDGNSMTYPYLFGLTPFMRLWRMIDLCFELGGYSVKENIFRESPYCDIVVLNNCADACVNNRIVFSDLVPNMTVGDLIVWLKDKFGAMVCYDGLDIRIKLIEDCLNMSPDIDLTEYALSDENISFPDSKRLVLNCTRSLEGSEVPADMSIEEYMSQYDTFWILKKFPINADSAYEGDLSIKPVLTLREGDVLSGRFETSGSFLGDLQGTLLGSMAFRYDRAGTDDSDDRSPEDLYVPMRVDDGKDLLCPYIGNAIYMHTRLEDSEEVAAEQPLIICWAFYDSTKGHWTGSSQPYDWSGNKVSDRHFPLTPDGVYHMFWKSYNRLLLCSAPTVEIQMNLPLSVLLNMDMSVPKLFKGQKVIMKSMAIMVSSTGARSGECTLQVIPSCISSVNDKDIYDPDSLEWKHIGLPVKRGANGMVEATDGITDYDAVPEAIPSYFGQRSGSRTRQGQITYHDGSSATSFMWKEYFIATFRE